MLTFELFVLLRISVAVLQAAGVTVGAKQSKHGTGGLIMGTFESRRPDECEGCIDLWGVHYCRWKGVPCVRVEDCPEGRGDDDD